MAVNQQPSLAAAVDGPHGLTSNNTKTHYPGTLGALAGGDAPLSARRQALCVTGMAGYLHGNGNVGPGKCQKSSW